MKLNQNDKLKRNDLAVYAPQRTVAEGRDLRRDCSSLCHPPSTPTSTSPVSVRAPDVSAAALAAPRKARHLVLLLL